MTVVSVAVTPATPPGVPGRVHPLTDYLASWARADGDGLALSFVDYTTDLAGTAVTLTWSRLHARVAATAARFARAAGRGERVAILAPQTDDYVVAFLAALMAGAVAVPLYAPGGLGGDERLEAVMADCDPACVATTTGTREAVDVFLKSWSGRRPLDVIAVDEPGGDGGPGGPAAPFTPPRLDVGDIAYLQYTSGSTRVPAGVMLTHANVVVNAFQALLGHRAERGSNTAVSWLPLFHDMGLLLSVAGPVVAGVHSVLMDPLAFVQRPVRWLQLVSRHPGVVTAAPNFAYDYCAKRVKEADKAGIQLGRVTSFANGAEPVQAATLRRFQAAFASCGLREISLRPTYGLAEATVFVCVSPAGRPPKTFTVDVGELELGRALAPTGRDAKATELVSSGAPVAQELRIVDPTTHRPQPDGIVGEIWLRGRNVGLGYWRQDEVSRRVFGAVLHEAAPREAARHDAARHDAAPREPHLRDDDGEPGGEAWLRTGDLGTMIDGELYVTGRIKDMIIIDGRNIYPHDIEACAEEAHSGVGRHRVAAFGVPSPGGEGVVVAAERYRLADGADASHADIARALRAAVSAEHSVALHDVVLLEPGTIPRTSSGKIARSACREAYLAGQWRAEGGGR